MLEDGFKEDYIVNGELYSKKKATKNISLNLLNRLNSYKD